MNKLLLIVRILPVVIIFVCVVVIAIDDLITINKRKMAEICIVRGLGNCILNVILFPVKSIKKILN